MKNLFLISVILLFGIFSRNYIYGQSDTIIDSDKKLYNLKGKLPEGWSLTSKDESLVIQKSEFVYILFENRINAPKSTEKPEQVKERIIKNGVKERPQFIFGIHKKLTSEELESIKLHNDSIYGIIKSLPGKYNIENLLDKFAMSKNEEIYYGKTEDEKARIEKYKNEKMILNGQIKKLPDYNTEKYSLYLNMIIGIDDELHLVYPYEVSEEMYKITNILNEILVTVK